MDFHAMFGVGVMIFRPLHKLLLVCIRLFVLFMSHWVVSLGAFLFGWACLMIPYPLFTYCLLGLVRFETDLLY